MKAWATAYAGPSCSRPVSMPPGKLRFRAQTLTAILTASGCPSLSLCVPVRNLDPDKSAVLSLPVPHCPSLSVKENDYESEGRRFESC
jgi:hypothetical protein